MFDYQSGGLSFLTNIRFLRFNIKEPLWSNIYMRYSSATILKYRLCNYAAYALCTEHGGCSEKRRVHLFRWTLFRSAFKGWNSITVALATSLINVRTLFLISELWFVEVEVILRNCNNSISALFLHFRSFLRSCLQFSICIEFRNRKNIFSLGPKIRFQTRFPGIKICGKKNFENLSNPSQSSHKPLGGKFERDKWIPQDLFLSKSKFRYSCDSNFLATRRIPGVVAGIRRNNPNGWPPARFAYEKLPGRESIYLYYAQAVAYLLPPRAIGPPPRIVSTRVGSRQYFRLPGKKNLSFRGKELSPSGSRWGEKSGIARETICDLVVVSGKFDVGNIISLNTFMTEN